MKVIGCIFVFAVALVATAVAPPPSGRIVGGYPTDIKHFPYQVALYAKGKFFCGGSIVGKRWILTAAHCVENKTAEEVWFRAGSSYFFSQGKIFNSEEIFIHPQYNAKKTDYDVALVYTSSDLVGRNVKPILIATDNKVSGSSEMFCASAYQTDACHGDSGGPAVMDGVQVGIISWGISCAELDYPGIYTNLAYPLIRSWIKDVAQI